MNRDLYQQVMQLVDQLLDRPVEERSAVLDEVCNGDGSLRREVEQLLNQHSSVTGFLEHSPVEGLSELSDPLIGSRVGPYRIIEEIGRGGMGAVYKAVRDDQEYRTEVAIKVIKRGMDTEYILRRFRTERQILANLNHPNIARLLDGGTTEDGRPYFVMEYIQGRPIDEYCDENRVPTSDRLKLFRTVCRAVQYAHENRVIHRDLKSSNVLMTADGTPKLLDFGIAKLLHTDESDSTTDITATMFRVMTPEYASPEQVKGEQVSTATDVYSLGVLLYELLTGQRPYRFKSRSPEDVAKAICEQEPAPPSTATGYVLSVEGDSGKHRSASQSEVREGSSEKLRRRLRGDLDNIVLMALKKEPERRYKSVQDFSEDIRRHLAGLPVTARKDTFAYRSSKFIRRNFVQNSRAFIVPAIISLTLIIFASVASYFIAKKSNGTPFQVRSVAVLPFKFTGTGSEDNPYLGMGFAGTLITNLGATKKLDVRPLTSVLQYVNANSDPRLTGQTLGVDAVVAGTIAAQGDAVQVSVQLVRVQTGETVWTRQLTGSIQDITSLQTKVSTELAPVISSSLTSEERQTLTRQLTGNAKAQDLYIKGRHFLGKRTRADYKTAIEFFNEALERDPNYAEAFAGLADGYALLACALEEFDQRPARMRLAKENALRALSIDEKMAEPHATLGFIGWHYEWDWAGSDKHFKRSIELNPSYAQAHHWYAYLLVRLKRMDEAVAAIRRARSLDPLSMIINQDVGQILIYARRYDEAIIQARDTLDLDPSYTGDAYSGARAIIIQGYYFKGMFEECVAELEKRMEVTNRDPETVVDAASYYFRMGRTAEAQKLLNELKARGKSHGVDSYWAFGKREDVYKWLAFEYTNRGAGITAVPIDPRFDDLRTDSRVQEYVRRTGLSW